MFPNQRRHPKNIPLITLKLISAGSPAPDYTNRHQYWAGTRAEARKNLQERRLWSCLYLATPGKKMSDVWVLGRQQDRDKDRTRAIFSNLLFSVIFLDLWTEVLLYGPLKPAHISAGPLWAACSGQTQLSTQAASRVPLTFKNNISIPHPFQMALGSCENPPRAFPSLQTPCWSKLRA